MRRELSKNYTKEEWEKLEAKNYNTTIEISNMLGKMKGFITAYSNPRSGKILLQHEGNFFKLDLTPVEKVDENECFKDFCRRNGSWFDSAIVFKEEEQP